MKFFIPLDAGVSSKASHGGRWNLARARLYGPFLDDQIVERVITRLKAEGEKTERFLIFDGRIFETRTGEQGRWIGSVPKRGG